MKQRKYSEALPLLQTASEKNNSEALYLRGVMYSNGIGVPRDDLAAFRLLSAAADMVLVILVIHDNP